MKALWVALCGEASADDLQDEKGRPLCQSKDWTPGLAVTHQRGQGWSVTHRPSGRAAASGLPSRKVAVAFMAAFESEAGIDWTLEADALPVDKITPVYQAIRARLCPDDAPAAPKRLTGEAKARAMILGRLPGPWSGAALVAEYGHARGVWRVVHPSGAEALIPMTDEEQAAEFPVSDLAPTTTLEVYNWPSAWRHCETAAERAEYATASVMAPEFKTGDRVQYRNVNLGHFHGTFAGQVGSTPREVCLVEWDNLPGKRCREWIPNLQREAGIEESAGRAA
jgi:hypothetical protein